MKDKLLEIYHHRRQQYLNREETDLKILQGLLKDLEGAIKELEEITEPKEQTHWYPDDSSEWVEYDGSGQPVDDKTIVDVLTRGERVGGFFSGCPSQGAAWYWKFENDNSDIVAYKVVKE